MNIVIYTTQFEPVTVMDIPLHLYQRLWKGERLKACVPPKTMVRPYDSASTPINDYLETISIWGELIRRGKYEGLLCFVSEQDEANALAVRSGFLPGQLAEVQHREAVATMRALLASVNWGALE